MRSTREGDFTLKIERERAVKPDFIPFSLLSFGLLGLLLFVISVNLGNNLEIRKEMKFLFVSTF